MTLADFNAKFITRIHHLWGVEFDIGKINAWYRVLAELKLNGLLIALDELALEIKFPPKIAEIVEAYEEVMVRETHAARKRQSNENQKLLSGGSLYFCDICRNNGVVSVYVDIDCSRKGTGYSKETPYSCVVRCSCGRGKDLNQWSRAQIDKGRTVTNPKTKEEESLYMPDVDDVFTPEEIGLIKAKNMSKQTGVTERTDIKAVVGGMVGRMTA